ncbi:hypothetical protein Leryth_016774 [Lithospermum erythrorhizon]|nr:hypothetical protein Leryth_016774 [Lithospermum erythrorhizon]
MSLGKVLHMNGGAGETSYANNSLFQQKGILRTKPLKEKVITDLYGNNQSPPTRISIADLGCSCGPNTLLMSLEIIEAIDELLMQGHIEEDKLYSFNIPLYTPSPSDIEKLVEEDGCFTIEYVDSFEDDWNESRKDSLVNDDGFNFMNTVRSVVEPLLLEHFNEGAIIEEIFKRYQKRIADCMAKEKTTLISLVACLKRKTK